MSDGLSMLDEKRKSRSRSIPSPRNPPRATPVEVADLAPAAAQTQPAAPVTETESATAEVPAATPAAEATEKTAAAEPTIKMSIYLEASDDLYLEEITHAGKTSRPRIAISRSAIVRLALERLAATMTADEIVDQLRKTGSEHQGAGRKRR